MTVFINSKQVIIHEGATILDAVLRYSKRSARMLLNGKLKVTDHFGYLTEPDGPLHEGQHMHLKRQNP